MTPEQYYDLSWQTAVYPNAGRNIEYPLFGLASEVGELCGEFARVIRDDGDRLSNHNRISRIYGELGDIYWNLSATAHELDRPEWFQSGSEFQTYDRIEPRDLKQCKDIVIRLNTSVHMFVYYSWNSLFDTGSDKFFKNNVKQIFAEMYAIGAFCGADPLTIMDLNIKKLSDRQGRGVLQGAGNNR